MSNCFLDWGFGMRRSVIGVVAVTVSVMLGGGSASTRLAAWSRSGRSPAHRPVGHNRVSVGGHSFSYGVAWGPGSSPEPSDDVRPSHGPSVERVPTTDFTCIATLSGDLPANLGVSVGAQNPGHSPLGGNYGDLYGYTLTVEYGATVSSGDPGVYYCSAVFYVDNDVLGSDEIPVFEVCGDTDRNALIQEYVTHPGAGVPTCGDITTSLPWSSAHFTWANYTNHDRNPRYPLGWVKESMVNGTNSLYAYFYAEYSRSLTMGGGYRTPAGNSYVMSSSHVRGTGADLSDPGHLDSAHQDEAAFLDILTQAASYTSLSDYESWLTMPAGQRHHFHGTWE